MSAVLEEPLLSRGRLFALGAGGAGAAFIGTLLYNSPPGGQSLLPPCPLYALTGVWCPGCGSGRALYSLMHGDFASFVTYNPAVVVMIAIAVAWGAIKLSDHRKGRAEPRIFPYRLSVALITALFVFAGLRNIAVEPFVWLAPHAA